MREYSWQARTRTGQTRAGVYTAPNREAVIAYLRAYELIPLAVEPRPRHFAPFEGPGRVKSRAVVGFTRQLAVMIDAGVPLLWSLQVVESQAEGARFARVIGDVKQQVQAGSTLAQALARHPMVFPEAYIQMIRAGEAGGLLDEVLLHLADYLEKKAEITKKIRGALMYPGIVLGMALVVIVFFMLVIIPVFQVTFADLGVPLPLPTRAVIGISALTSDHASILLLLLALAVFGGVSSYRTPRGRTSVDALLLRLPLFGPLLIKAILARVTRTLATLLQAGVPILEAVDISARTSGNSVVEAALLRTKGSITAGSSLTDPLGRVGLLPPMVVQMVRIGEETGRLDEALVRVAEFYRDEVNIGVESFSSLLEPVLIVLVAVLVGALIISLYLPIFEVAQAFGI